jgi:hypothetical protein
MPELRSNIKDVVWSNDLFTPTEAAQPLLFNSGIRTAEGGANVQNNQ